MSQKVERYKVVAISDEFLEIVKEIPEASTAKSVQWGGKRIEGAKTVLITSSMEEVEKNLPAIVEKLADPQHHHLRIVKQSGQCYPSIYQCEKIQDENPNIAHSECIDCPRFEKTPLINEAWTIDAEEILQSIGQNTG